MSDVMDVLMDFRMFKIFGGIPNRDFIGMFGSNACLPAANFTPDAAVLTKRLSWSGLENPGSPPVPAKEMGDRQSDQKCCFKVGWQILKVQGSVGKLSTQRDVPWPNHNKTTN